MNIFSLITKKLNIERRWVFPRYDKNNEPHFLFIITPPYSGSTAISKLLDSSEKTIILQERAEGQWLLSCMCGGDRWDKDKFINHESVKAV